MNRQRKNIDKGYKRLEENFIAHKGKKKHEAKEDARREGLPANRVGGIRSSESLKTYKKCFRRFIEAIGKLGIVLKCVEDYEHLVKGYLQKMVDDFNAGNGYSASYIGTIASALGAVFYCSKTSFGVALPIRRACDFKNSRHDDTWTLNLNKFSPSLNISLGAGARRGGQMKLAEGDYRYNKYGNMELWLDEKGGKERYTLVLPDYEYNIYRTLQNSNGIIVNGKHRIFMKSDISRGTTECRAAYNMNLYKFYERLIKEGKIKKPIYKKGKSPFYVMRGTRKGEVLDRWILRKVSLQTGHGPYRESLIVNNYIRKGFGLYTEACKEYNQLKLK